MKKQYEIKKEKELKNKWIIYFLIIIICWIPVFIAFWPVIINYDGGIQIYGFAIKNLAPSTKQPIISTLIFSFFYLFGVKVLDSATLGMMTLSIFQILIMSGIFAYTTKFIYAETKNKLATIITLIFYAIMPFNQLFPLMTTKDVLFAGISLVFVINLYKLTKEDNKIKEYILFIIIGVLMLLFRNNAIYAIIATIPFIIIVMKKQRQNLIKILICILIITMLYQLLYNILIIITKGTKDDDKEKMSLISQAVARVSSEKLEELNEEEKEKISYYFGDVYNLAKIYEKNISDPTKAIIEIDKVNENKSEFYKFVISLGKKYPLIYIDSFLDTTKEYWYIQGWTLDVKSLNQRTYLELNSNIITDGKNERNTVRKYNIWPQYKRMYVKLFEENNYIKIPIIHLIFQQSTYFYILLFCFLYAIYKRRVNVLVPIIFLLLYFLTCFLGPVALIRYVYIDVVATPVILSILLYREN